LAARLGRKAVSGRVSTGNIQRRTPRTGSRMLDEKQKGREITIPPHAPPRSQVVDLYEALKGRTKSLSSCALSFGYIPGVNPKGGTIHRRNVFLRAPFSLDGGDPCNAQPAEERNPCAAEWTLAAHPLMLDETETSSSHAHKSVQHGGTW